MYSPKKASSQDVVDAFNKKYLLLYLVNEDSKAQTLAYLKAAESRGCFKEYRLCI